MKSLYIIYGCYKPNIAPTNRLLAFLKNFDRQGVHVVVVFVYPNDKEDRLDASGYKYLTVMYLWEGRHKQNKLVKYLRSLVDASRYAKRLPSQSKVLVVGSSEYMPFFAGRNDLQVYQERTEHYGVVTLHPGFLQKRYLKAVPKLKGMFVISTALKKAYEMIGAKNVSVVNMTVDANRFESLHKKDDQEKYVAYCGTASNNKDGVDDLIKAFTVVHKEYPTLKLYIIGKVPIKADASGNRELVESLGLVDVVDFKGVIPADEMPQILKNAELLALARPDSLQAQCGFPTKLGEYLLTGNPVVVTKVGDIPLFLKDGESALLAEQRNPEDFASKMLWALMHVQEAKVIGQIGKDVAMREFNSKTESEKIIKTIFQD